MAYRDTRNLGKSDECSKRQWSIETREFWVEVTNVLEGNVLSTDVLDVSCWADSSPIVSINYTIALITTYER